MMLNIVMFKGCKSEGVTRNSLQMSCKTCFILPVMVVRSYPRERASFQPSMLAVRCRGARSALVGNMAALRSRRNMEAGGAHDARLASVAFSGVVHEPRE